MLFAKIGTFVPLALILLPWVIFIPSVATASHFYDQIGFPHHVLEFSDGQKIVKMFSFQPDEINVRQGASTVQRFLGMVRASKVAMEPGRPPMRVPYYSFYKSSQKFYQKQSHKGNSIKELASKLLQLISILSDVSVFQSIWLRNNLNLVEECQVLAQNALSNPQNLNDLERLWAIGIWVSLQIGTRENRTSELQIPQFFSKQVILEIKATLCEFYPNIIMNSLLDWSFNYITFCLLDYTPVITEAFDNWVNQKCLTRNRALEECLKRAALIGFHEEKHEGQPISVFHPIEKLVSKHLTDCELPQATQNISNLLSQLCEIFKDMEVQSWEGQYTIEIFKHIMSFSSSSIIVQSFKQVIQDENIWRDFHIPFAKHDIIQLSEKMKPFLTKCKISSKIDMSLYPILKDPLQEHEFFNDAIMKLLRSLKTIPKKQLKNAYQLIMAHELLTPSVEHGLIAAPSWDIVDGLQRSWAVLYPGFTLMNVEVMDYTYYILLKYPHLLAHARWNAFVHDAKKSLKTILSSSSIKTLLEKPHIPYDVSSYGEEYYYKLFTIMKDGNDKVLYTKGLELLMILNDYLPKGPDCLLKMLKEEQFGDWVNLAIGYVRFYFQYAWHHGGKTFGQLIYFVEALHSIITLQRQGNADGEICAEWRRIWPPKTVARMKIGGYEFYFDPSNWEGSWNPFGPR
ncbi:hypothetical protein DFH28DRAFT_1065093 [Melampsora americana]|nr:hypothetical protein DFH28DRAFT_1065093 [Melampsora americana]